MVSKVEEGRRSRFVREGQEEKGGDAACGGGVGECGAAMVVKVRNEGDEGDEEQPSRGQAGLGNNGGTLWCNARDVGKVWYL